MSVHVIEERRGGGGGGVLASLFAVLAVLVCARIYWALSHPPGPAPPAKSYEESAVPVDYFYEPCGECVWWWQEAAPFWQLHKGPPAAAELARKVHGSGGVRPVRGLPVLGQAVPVP